MEIIKQSDLLDLYYNYFDDNNYKAALDILLKMDLNLKDSSWINAKIAECHYEVFDYQKAVDYCILSLKFQPKYPLALWTISNAYYYLSEYTTSIKYLKKILKLSIEEIGKVETKMGIRWARSLQMDSLIILSDCYYMLEQDSLAISFYNRFKSLRQLKTKSYLSKLYLKNMGNKIREII